MGIVFKLFLQLLLIHLNLRIRLAADIYSVNLNEQMCALCFGYRTAHQLVTFVFLISF